MVPRRVDDVHEADSAFDHASSQQAVLSEAGPSLTGLASAAAFGLFRTIDAVRGQGCLSFAREVDQFRSCTLHAKREFVTGDTAGDLRILLHGQPSLIEIPQCVEPASLQFRRQAGGVRQVEDGFSLIAEQDAGID